MRRAAAEGESVEIATVGVYELPKAPATVIAQGARVAWDDTAKQIALPGVGLYPIGVAVLVAGNGATDLPPVFRSNRRVSFPVN